MKIRSRLIDDDEWLKGLSFEMPEVAAEDAPMIKVLGTWVHFKVIELKLTRD